MADRPIVFSAPMIRALLDGRKTQTRRVLKPQPAQQCAGFKKVFADAPYFEARDAAGKLLYAFHYPESSEVSPFPPIRYAVGDRLWVREMFSGPHRMGDIPPRDWAYDLPIHYWADGNPEDGDWTRPKPSIHMPRWASRLTLIVTDVRAQRVQEISEADARAEGVRRIHHGDGDYYFSALRDEPAPGNWSDPTDAFSELWDAINGIGAWAQNPWVVVLTFITHRCNIDQMEARA